MLVTFGLIDKWTGNPMFHYFSFGNCFVHLIHVFRSLACAVCRKLPFQKKHVLQQASILGNLEEFGVLKSYGVDVMTMIRKDCNGSSSTYHSDVPAVVEFGAGRGYLTQMLADCYGIKQVFLVERKSYKLKVCRFELIFNAFVDKLSGC